MYTPNLGTDVLGAAASRSSEKTKWDFARLSALPRMRGRREEEEKEAPVFMRRSNSAKNNFQPAQYVCSFLNKFKFE